MLSKILSFLGGGASKTIEGIATEWIETDLEKAEAQSLMIKTLDPNGIMRRELSRFASMAYGFYLVAMVVLSLLHSFDVSDAKQTLEAINAMKELFVPITTAWGGIVGASFGVNGLNASKGR